MTTPTPTGDADGRADWIPDDATLSKIASEIFGEYKPADLGRIDGAAAGQDQPGLIAAPDAARQAAEATRMTASQPSLSWPASTAAGTGVPGRAADDLATFAQDAWGPQVAPTFYFVQERADEAPRAEVRGSPPGPAQAMQRATRAAFDVAGVRRDFPILGERVHGRQLVWLDNAATTQKPQAVIDRLAHFYATENSNVHRGAHALAARATEAYEGARQTVADFLGASAASEIVFTRGATEAINLIAQAWGPDHVGPGDEIVLSQLEHHANIVPWQQLADRVGARLRVIPVDDDGQIDLAAYGALLSERTRLVAVAHVSNVLGTVVPVQEIIAAARRAGARVLVDGAQAVAHMPVDVGTLDADFYVFSGHKIFGPTGIGALYAKREILHGLSPWQGGGNMIKDVTFERTLYEAAPRRFEAGTGSIADAAGLAAALGYVSGLGLPSITGYEGDLMRYATAQVEAVPGLRLIGTAADKAGVLSFVLAGYSPEEVGSALDSCAIAVRAGHHCAQPILRRYGLEGAVRASVAMYNTRAEVDLLASALDQLAAGAGRR
jgi:cysteine desulfurase / selenocysteine lyase